MLDSDYCIVLKFVEKVLGIFMSGDKFID